MAQARATMAEVKLMMAKARPMMAYARAMMAKARAMMGNISMPGGGEGMDNESTPGRGESMDDDSMSGGGAGMDDGTGARMAAQARAMMAKAIAYGRSTGSRKDMGSEVGGRYAQRSGRGYGLRRRQQQTYGRDNGSMPGEGENMFNGSMSG